MVNQKITLRAARVNANLTQDQVANNLKVAKKTVQNWEKGVTLPSVVQALALQELFRYPLDAIFFGSCKAESEMEE